MGRLTAALGAAAAILVLALASCGGSPGSQGPASSPGTGATLNSSPTTAPSSSHTGWG